MRRAVLRRDRSGVHGTLGSLAAPALAPLHVMEPPWRGNRRNRSCIPAGLYEVVPHLSPRHRRCLLVTQVPGRSHILFHAGNLGGDVERGWHTHTRGCLLPGLRRGRLAVGGRRQAAVLASRTALRQLMDWAAGRPFELEIVAQAGARKIAPAGAWENVAPTGAREIAPEGARREIAPTGAWEMNHA